MLDDKYFKNQLLSENLYIINTTGTRDLDNTSCVSERIHKSTTTIDLQKEELTRDSFHRRKMWCPSLMLVMKLEMKSMFLGVGATQDGFSPSF